MAAAGTSDAAAAAAMEVAGAAGGKGPPALGAGALAALVALADGSGVR